MKSNLLMRLCALLTLPLGATFAQSASSDESAAPTEVRRIALVPAQDPAPPEPPEAPKQSRAQLGVYLGGEGHAAAPGARVNALVAGSGAESAGLQPGDRILAIGDRRISTTAELIEAVQSKRAGDSVRLTVDRDGWRKVLEVRLGDAAQSDAEPQQLRARWFQVDELEEVESPHRSNDADGSAELEELRELIQREENGPRDIRVERRVFINGKELSREQLEEFGEQGEWWNLPEPSHDHQYWFEGQTESGDAHERHEAPQRVRVRLREEGAEQPDAQRMERIERMAQERRMQRAERLREVERSQVNDRRRQAERLHEVERSRTNDRRQRTEREPARDEALDRARQEFEALRAELDQMRAELDELRASLRQSRRERD